MSMMPAKLSAPIPTMSAPGDLLPVCLIQDPSPAQNTPIEIVIDDRTIIRIASGVDPSLLRQVIEVLR